MKLDIVMKIYMPKFLLVLFAGMSVITVGGAVVKTVWAHGGEGALGGVAQQNQSSSATVAPLAPSGSGTGANQPPTQAQTQTQTQSATSTPAHISIPGEIQSNEGTRRTRESGGESE